MPVRLLPNEKGFKSDEHVMLERLAFLRSQVAAGRSEFQPALDLTIATIQGGYEPTTGPFAARRSEAVERYRAKLAALPAE